ncbi:hypothetical protein OOU_Y34scaffold00516g35 [Pyricularia oryzae Y34]|uniref:Uncharacterized protein n=3 Tax=Pyricularia oryzae TaxID=318829 RepID=A0A4V1C6D5_PYROR|nr:hypothetical protein OOU_Y34scaffold00516g35 [Pyricularia oryzae Y34]QBZ59505.1 hypothetical protein PoMZ_04466 [Pyricularia oryzae]
MEIWGSFVPNFSAMAQKVVIGKRASNGSCPE